MRLRGIPGENVLGVIAGECLNLAMPLPRLPFVLLLALASGIAAAKDRARSDDGPFIEYLPGTLPLVISAPHGGYLKPAGMPDRQEGKVEQDGFTQEMARALREEFLARTGGTPYLIICRLHRVKVDCNREIKEAAQGNALAEKAWHEYHDAIEQAKAAVQTAFGAGLYIDLHGQRHAEGRVEIGYLLTPKELALDDEAIAKLAVKTGIRELGQRSPAGAAWARCWMPRATSACPHRPCTRRMTGSRTLMAGTTPRYMPRATAARSAVFRSSARTQGCATPGRIASGL